MDYGIVDILRLLGSLVLFLYGMKLMSESLQKVAGDKMRGILSAMTSNRFKGMLTGILITAVIQSSSATTVMLVSFVNAGLLSLVEAIGVIMGANIGTTVTAWLISILGFKVKMSALVLPLMGIALPLIFSKNRNRSNWGGVTIGFAIIFIGLDFLKGSTPDINSNPQILEFLTNFSDLGYASIFIYLFIGTLLTVIIQSSSAVMALTLVMCFNGWLSYEMAAAMVLGENIGTTITANLAALIANTSAKRTARAHLIFNVLGVILVLIFFYPFLKMVGAITIGLGFDSPMGAIGQSAEQTAAAIPIGLSIFHTTFNIIFSLLLVWFVPLIARIVTWMVPDKDDDEEFKLKHISTGLLSTSELSILQAKKESLVYGRRVVKMIGLVKELLEKPSEKESSKIIDRIAKYEDIADRMEEEIIAYLSQLGEEKISPTGSEEVNEILSVISKIESIADSCNTIAKTVDRQIEKNIVLTDQMNANIAIIQEINLEQLQLVLSNMETNKEIDKGHDGFIRIDARLNKEIKRIKTEHFKNIKKKVYKIKDGIIYTDIYNELATIGKYAYEINKEISEGTSAKG